MFFCQVLVIIDVKPKDLGLPTEAYISVEEVHDVRHLVMSLFRTATFRAFGVFPHFKSTNTL